MLPGAVLAQQPLSAIDWLTNPVPVTTRITPKVNTMEPPVARSAVVPDVTVTPLEEATADAVGLLAATVTGLPVTLWQNSQSAKLVGAIQEQDVLGLPAMQSLLYTLLLAEAEPPSDAGPGHRFLRARIAKLMELGAVEPAQALIERAGPQVIALFPLWFDLSLLTGSEEVACKVLGQKPFLSPDPATRVFCAARQGDWTAAALILESARALGLAGPTELALLSQFLEPELIEESAELPPPRAITPLIFRLYEAAGAPLPTSSLPRAFAMADLRDTSGWKAELEAAERLSRTGALSENRLMAYYTARHPAASGGIWDRVEAIQRFDIAVQSGDPGAVAATLGGAWSAIQQAHLEVPFARFYAASLARLPLTGEARTLAFTVGLLSPDYEAISARMSPNGPEEEFLAALARGEPERATTRDPLGRAISKAFQENTIPEVFRPLLEQRRLGEAILLAMQLFSNGVEGDFNDLEIALQGFRVMGLEDTARRAGLQLMLLNQGG